MSNATLTKTFSDKAKSCTQQQLERLKEMFPEEYDAWIMSKPLHKNLRDFVTVNPKLIVMKKEVELLSEIPDPVLIVGPTGTGKELIAAALHGDRPGKFIPINCAGIPENLIESELFGHVKGSFTGAHQDKVGLLQAAYDGTIFLDELGELPMPVQAKLLRALNEKKIRRVGDATDEINITCRIVAATHRDIKGSMIPAGMFREDLYWRIAMFTIEIPPLSGRPEDIMPIVKHIIIRDKGLVKHDIEDIEDFCYIISKNREKLSGNVRQLQKIVRNFHVLGKLPEFN